MPTITLKNVPPELHAALKKSATRHRRSLNQEALHYLETALDADSPPVSAHASSLDAERAAWLAQSERRLGEVWENDEDEVYNELLEK